MSRLLGFTVITLFIARIQIVRLAKFSSGVPLPFPVQASERRVLCVKYKWSITVLLKGPSFLSVYQKQRSPSSPCLSQNVYVRLLKEKCTSIVLRFVGTLGVGVPVGTALSKHKITTQWKLLSLVYMLFWIYSQGALLGWRLRNTGRNRWKVWEKAGGSGSVETISSLCLRKTFVVVQSAVHPLPPPHTPAHRENVNCIDKF